MVARPLVARSDTARHPTQVCNTLQSGRSPTLQVDTHTKSAVLLPG
jgi:hypothetical protein